MKQKPKYRIKLVNVLVVWLAGTFPIAGYAACNKPNNWLDAPDSDVKFLIVDGGSIDDFGEIPSIRALYPRTISKNTINTDGSRHLSDGRGMLSFYEPDNKGDWRVCRRDFWEAELKLGDGPAENKIRKISNRYKNTSTEIAKITNKSWLLSSQQYFYDANGRLDHTSKWSYATGTEKIKPVSCYRYDSTNRVLLWTNPIFSEVCPTGEPDKRDSWKRYAYGTFKGKEIRLLDLSHSGKFDGTWKQKYALFQLGPEPDAPYGGAEANSDQGVTSVIGSNFGKRDDNPENTVVDSFGRWNGSNYFFTQPPVSLALLKNPELIYQFQRRRKTNVDGPSLQLIELFEADSHISRNKYYLLDGYLLRHIQVGADGRVNRVITVDDWHPPRPGKNPSFEEKNFNSQGIKLSGHKIHHRVYDFDKDGKPKLVAISWNPNMQINPFKGTSMDFEKLIYGTPSGKEQWKSKADFEKFFETSSRASHVFPDEQHDEH